MGLEAPVKSTGTKGPRPYLRFSVEKVRFAVFRTQLATFLGIAKGNINNTVVYKFKVTFNAGRAVTADTVTL